MRVGIDASNISSGGGLTHLVELLSAADPVINGFDSVVVWATKNTLAFLNPKPWLILRSDPVLDGSILHRGLWQRSIGKLARDEACDILFIPGGSYVADFKPVVVMSQNLLPFQWREAIRYGISMMTLKWLALYITQSSSMRRADGIIFLTNYAKDAVFNVIGALSGRTAIVSHGIDCRFYAAPRPQKNISEYSEISPYKILYVSPVEPYKHQWHVANAVARLRNEGYPVCLEFVGASYTPALKRLRRELRRLDPDCGFIRYVGYVSHGKLHERYLNADCLVFASTCETFGQILVEGMATGLPIACSGVSAMPELLGDAGIYFISEDPASIADALRRYIVSPDLRYKCAQQAQILARSYSWNSCAKETFEFIRTCATINKKGQK